MGKIVILAGLLAGAALFTAGTPANAAWVGCQCFKLGQAPVCVPGVLECAGMGGVCLAPCDYLAPVKKHHRRHRRPMHKKKK